ncbi:hypothetical protein IJ103_00340 [Candidatus Saccharibacteria bacterium]|nr:hypothetical protein [Candidatus Saccharibacteria bacterium]MBQ9016681.1 hypothetical protein [Candidatus Saccharibacteria bacterium]
MRVVVLTKEGYDYSSTVDAFITELESGGGEVERLDPDTYEGESLARSLDILEFPAVVVVDANGTAIQQWLGVPLPPVSEVAYYINL